MKVASRAVAVVLLAAVLAGLASAVAGCETVAMKDDGTVYPEVERWWR